VFRSGILIQSQDVKLIKGIQKRATKMVQGIQHWKYDNRLNYLGLMHLERRGVRSDLTETFKIMNGMYDVNKEILCNWMKVVEEDVTKNCLKRVRCKVSIVNDWNSLSSQCVNCCTVNTLKNVFYLNWNWKLLNYVSCMSFEIAGIVWHIILCLLIPAVSLTLLASVESVKYLVDTK